MSRTRFHIDGEDIKVVDATEFLIVTYPGRSAPVIVPILGRETSRGGVETLWLDRLIHRPQQERMGEWNVAGAISTVLTRKKIDQFCASNTP